MLPLFSWEELGKIDSNLLRTLRHIGFSKYKPSFDGECYLNDVNIGFDMQEVYKSDDSDFPKPMNINKIKKYFDKDKEKAEFELKKLNLNSASLTDIMTLYAMQEELAVEIHEYIQENIITDSTDLLELESIDEQMLKCWDKNLDDMRVDINSVEEYELIKNKKEQVKKLAKTYNKNIKKQIKWF